MKNAAQFEMCRIFAIFLSYKKFSFHAFPKRRAAGDDDESEPKDQTAREGYMDHIRLSWRPKV